MSRYMRGRGEIAELLSIVGGIIILLVLWFIILPAIQKALPVPHG